MMKTRIIAGLICTALVITLLFFMDTPLLPILLAIASGISVYELSSVVKVKLPMKILSIAAGMFIPFNAAYGLLDKIGVTPMTALTVYFITMLIMMIRWNSEVKFEQVSMCLISSVAVPNAVSCWLRLYNWQFPGDTGHVEAHAVYMILFTAFCAWMTDTCAYFTGVCFGKHKMAPVISPKKTWEGAIGGVLLTAVINVILFLVYDKWFFGVPFNGWVWYEVIPISILLSVISIFGDLSASVIKRNYGIKDYGNLIPGHGGMMDRIDSAIFVFPAMYAIVNIINAF
ncbi:MAG: phosphatidate cytidylyltransferase [Clostridia bacterium]|nr:phosphatidate cytidylyltransferase [Clostridia bacterium]